MIISKDWSAFLGGVALLACSACDASELSYRLSATKVQAGEHAVVEVRLPIPTSKLNLEEIPTPEVNDDLVTQSKTFQVIERDFKRENTDWVWRYEITAYQPGMITIPPIEIRSEGANYSTESMPLEIATSRGENDDALRPEFGPIKKPLPWALLIRWAFLIAIMNAAFYFLKKHFPRIVKKPKLWSTTPTSITYKEDDKEWLKRELARLRTELEVAPDKGIVIDKITKVIREYYARRSQLPVESWTTQELKLRFPNETSLETISTLFEKCDHFKFGGRFGDAYRLAKNTLEESERTLLAC